MTTREKFMGCLVGCAIGDAVGAPVESLGFQHCQKYVQNYVRPQRFETIRRAAYGDLPTLPFGQVTDDTQLTVLLALAIKRAGRPSPEYFGDLLVQSFAANRVVGSGRATRYAVANLTTGMHWREAGAPPPQAGNGTAMRAAPLGLFLYHDTEALIQAAYETSYVTHQDPQCTAGAIAIALATAKAVQGEDPHKLPWLEGMMGAISRYDDAMAEALREVWLRWGEDPVGMSQFVQSFDPPLASGHGRIWDRISPYVLPSVLWSLYAYLHTPDDFWETICTAVSPGGDVDTTGAMAGAISGAHNGLQALPTAVVNVLRDQGQPDLALYLKDLASSLFDLISRAR